MLAELGSTPTKCGAVCVGLTPLKTKLGPESAEFGTDEAPHIWAGSTKADNTWPETGKTVGSDSASQSVKLRPGSTESPVSGGGPEMWPEVDQIWATRGAERARPRNHDVAASHIVAAASSSGARSPPMLAQPRWAFERRPCMAPQRTFPVAAAIAVHTWVYAGTNHCGISIGAGGRPEGGCRRAFGLSGLRAAAGASALGAHRLFPQAWFGACRR